MNFFKKTAAYVSAAGAALFAGSANATVLTDAQTAISSASSDALAVGGYVVAAVAALIVISLILSMIRKL